MIFTRSFIPLVSEGSRASLPYSVCCLASPHLAGLKGRGGKEEDEGLFPGNPCSFRGVKNNSNQVCLKEESSRRGNLLHTVFCSAPPRLAQPSPAPLCPAPLHHSVLSPLSSLAPSCLNLHLAEFCPASPFLAASHTDLPVLFPFVSLLLLLRRVLPHPATPITTQACVTLLLFKPVLVCSHSVPPSPRPPEPHPPSPSPLPLLPSSLTLTTSTLTLNSISLS